MATLAKLIQNLVYVTVDRTEARRDWMRLAEGVALMHDDPEHMAACFLADNWQHFAKQKAVAGILGNKRRLNWLRYRIRETRLERELQWTVWDSADKQERTA